VVFFDIEQQLFSVVESLAMTLSVAGAEDRHGREEQGRGLAMTLGGEGAAIYDKGFLRVSQ
jgi:hypothetical protein